MSTTKELFSDSIAEVINEESLRKRLDGNKPLIIKLGVDPTSPDLHLGHAVVLRKLRQFQDLGHKAVLVIGDFTARIGDPSGKNTTRPVISEAEIKANMKTYAEQAEIILDKTKTEIVYNSTWLSKMCLDDLIKISMQVSLNTLLEREDFSSRLSAGESVSVHELLYPITQALDSVELKADIEIGGWDQRLNLLLGRELQKKLGQVPQEVVILRPLVGLDGERKMSKSYGNYIALTDSPDQMFGKVMSIPDKAMTDYAILVAQMKEEEIKNLPNHPREAKEEIAKRIVTLYYSEDAAKKAAEVFRRVFTEKGQGSDVADEVAIKGQSTIHLMEAVKHAAQISGSEAQRLIEQRAVKIDGEILTDPRHVLDVRDKGMILQVGKHRFYELVPEE